MSTNRQKHISATAFDDLNKGMMMSKVVSVQLFFLILGNSFAWDGCSYGLAWRCGDVCIDMNAECKCGNEIFAKEDQKWCCHNSTCTDKGEEVVDYNYW